MLTHEHFRDKTSSCTIADVESMANLSAFPTRKRRKPSQTLEHSIWHANVTIIRKPQKDPLIHVPAPVKPSPLFWGKDVITALLSLLAAHPTLIYMNHVLVCCCIDILMLSMLFLLVRSFFNYAVSFLKNVFAVKSRINQQ